MAVLGAEGWPDLIEPFAGGADEVAADGASAFEVTAGLRAGAGDGWRVLALRIGVSGLPVGLEAGEGQRADGFEDRRQEGEEGRPWAGGTHGSGQADAEGDLAEGGTLAGLEADSGMDQLAGERRGDGQGEHTVGLSQVGADEDFEGAVGAGGAVPAPAGGLGALSGGGEADGDAQALGQGSAELGEHRSEVAGDIGEPAFAVGVLVGAWGRHGWLLSRL